eukprot:365252-Chlamydomonas_euryale.AAC.30
MIIRLRSRDGLERKVTAQLFMDKSGIGLQENVGGLRTAINSKLGIPVNEMHLSKDAALLTSKEPGTQFTVESSGGKMCRALVRFIPVTDGCAYLVHDLFVLVCSCHCHLCLPTHSVPVNLVSPQDLAKDSVSLQSAGIAHGDMVYLLYGFERDVEPVYKKNVFEGKSAAWGVLSYLHAGKCAAWLWRVVACA